MSTFHQIKNLMKNYIFPQLPHKLASQPDWPQKSPSGFSEILSSTTSKPSGFLKYLHLWNQYVLLVRLSWKTFNSKSPRMLIPMWYKLKLKRQIVLLVTCLELISATLLAESKAFKKHYKSKYQFHWIGHRLNTND